MRVVNVEMCALISCAHVLKHFMHSPTFTPLPFSLGELADIFDLACLPAFDNNKLLDLANRFRGHEAVQFAGNLLQAYFTSNPLAPASFQPWPHKDSFPRPISLGCWASLYNNADDLLLPLNTELIVDNLRADTVAAQASESQKSRLIFSQKEEENGGESTPRVLVQTAQEELTPFQVSVLWKERSLDFELDLFETLEDDGYHYHIAVFCGSSATHEDFHAMYVCQGRTTLHQTGQGQSSMSLLEDVCKLHLSLSLPWNILPETFQERNSGSVLLQIIKRYTPEGNSVDDVDTILIVPLKIVRSEVAAVPCVAAS